jgi:predicted murein hydrolase (TIGR00659 family)
MKEFLQSEIFLLLFTFAVFFAAQALQKRVKILLLNPILVSIIIIITFLTVFNIDYPTYKKGSRLIEFFLKPAVVALGVPLYKQLENIKKQAVPVLLSQLAGCIAGVVSVVFLAKIFGASQQIILSLAPKSVTSPIAIEISGIIGGIPALTASVTIVVGVFGAVFGYKILQIFKIESPFAQGISMGTAAHGIGTSKSMEISSRYGAMSGLGLILNGIFTALLTPLILKILGYF